MSQSAPQQFDSPEARLEAARSAYARLTQAEAQVCRLSTYTHPNPRMRADRAQWLAQQSKARADLVRALARDEVQVAA